jgi:hypothetical protein
VEGSGLGMENQKKRKFEESENDQEISSASVTAQISSPTDHPNNALNTSQILQNLQKHLLNDK